MRVYNNNLYVGTMDHSYLLGGDDSGLDLFFDTPEYGADLYRFDNANSDTVAVSLDGMGNPMNYGIRTMITDNTALYLGTANPMNLNPDGGWELIKLLAPPPVTVPNFVGMTQAEAEAAIIDANLRVGSIGFACSDTEGAGIVASQNLPAGIEVSPGTEVDLVVSYGPCLVPDCVGLTQALAQATITHAGFDVGTIENECHRTAPAGTVIGQNPDAGTAGSSGSSVNLTVSTGPCSLNGRSTVGRRSSPR